MPPLHTHAQIAVPADEPTAAIYRALILQSLAWWQQHGTAVLVSETAEAGVFELSLMPLADVPAPPLRGRVWVELNFLQDDTAYFAPVYVVWELPAQEGVPELVPQTRDAAQLPVGLPWATAPPAGGAVRST